jgi:ligand-binding sensor domain-containing protein/signal transduction histidine kinase
MGGLNPSSPQHLWRFFASAFLLLWPLTPIASQYRVESWSTDNGLPQNSVRSIIQTRDGYLWLTTFDGLVRFDGVHFAVFDKSNTKGLSTNRFTSLYEDKDGTLWIGTGDGGLTFYRDGVFRSITVADGMPAGQVLAIAPDLNGEMLLNIDSNRFYLRDGKFIAAPPEYNAPDTTNYLAPSGTQWTITSNGARQVSNGRVTQYQLNFGKDVSPYEDSQGNLWLGNESGVYRLRDGQITRYGEKDGVPPRTRLRPACEDDQGGVWFIGNGLVRFKDGRFTVHRELTDAGIYCLFKDREGTVWVGTANGLHRLTRNFITGYSTKNGLLNNEVYPILQSRNGDIWVGSISGLSRFRDGKFKNISLSQSKANVQALGEDSAGNLWVGTVDGLLRFKNGKFENLSSLIGNTVSTILTDRNGNVWVGCARGLFKFNDDRVVAHYTTRDGLPKDDVTVIHEDRNGNLWTGTSGALAQFKDGRFISYWMADTLATNHIWTICEDNDGTFWIGTYDDGLSRFRDGRFFTYKKENGLFDNGVFQILEDGHGYFWISCNRGIYRVSRQELNDFAAGRISRVSSIAYGKNDGMLNVECNGGRLPAGIKARDGKLWFPTQAGVAIVDSDAVPLNPHAPPVLIESVTLEQRPIDFRSGVTVEPGQQDLEIIYTGLHFIKSDQIKFKYKLEGLDANWIDAGTRRMVHFPYLPPGTYTFRVIAANSDGVWNETGASFSLIVRAPFWRHSWFWLLCAVTIAAITAFVMWGRLVQLKRRHAEREVFARQLIESQEGERKRLARELHDSLAQSLLIVKNWALVGLNSLAPDNPAREHLTEISETTSLALSEVREIAQNLRPPQLERLGLTSTIKEMVQHVSNSSDIEFITEIDNIDGLLSKESEINLFRVVQECVNNVLKHSAATESWLSIKRTARGAQVICRDNGKGFDPTARVPKRGIGLIGIGERVRMLGASWTMEAAIGKGATICITVERARGE